MSPSTTDTNVKGPRHGVNSEGREQPWKRFFHEEKNGNHGGDFITVQATSSDDSGGSGGSGGGGGSGDGAKPGHVAA